jgi:hypothetical protein
MGLAPPTFEAAALFFTGVSWAPNILLMTGWHLPRFPSMYVATAMMATTPTMIAMMTPMPRLSLLLDDEEVEGHLQ